MNKGVYAIDIAASNAKYMDIAWMKASPTRCRAVLPWRKRILLTDKDASKTERDSQ